MKAFSIRHPTAAAAAVPVAAEAAQAQTAPSDTVLVKQAQAGDATAFDELFERYKDRIYRVVYHITSNREDANDLVQEAFIKAYRSLHGFKGSSSFYTWIYRIAVNTTLNFSKHRAHHPHLSFDEMDESVKESEAFVNLTTARTASKDLTVEELQEKLNKALQKLSEPHRAVITLHDIEGLPHEEIARIMNCSEGTVRSRLYYARQELQGLLSEYLGTDKRHEV
jgi:RNA polymerase sigma-70 factor (ECF subfamily)